MKIIIKCEAKVQGNDATISRKVRLPIPAYRNRPISVKAFSSPPSEVRRTILLDLCCTVLFVFNKDDVAILYVKYLKYSRKKVSSRQIFKNW